MKQKENVISIADRVNLPLNTKIRIDENQNKTFIYDFTTYLKDSNAYGNNYFAKVFEWQGFCRESWFFNCIAKDFLKDKGVLITKTAHNEYKNESFPFEEIRCKLNIENIKKASFDLMFCFCDKNDESKILSLGYQTVVFANHQRKITKFPQYILDKVTEYSCN